MALNLAQVWNDVVTRARRVAGTRTRPRITSVTALDRDGEALHVVQAGLRGGQPRLATVATLPLDSPAASNSEDPVAVGQAIAAALNRARLNPRAVVMGIPRTQVVLRTLELPPTARTDEIAAMVHLRLGRDLPFPLEEALIDFSPVGGPAGRGLPGRVEPAQGSAPIAGGSATRVLTAVVRRKTVEHLQAVARAAGCTLVTVGLRSLAGARATVACVPRAAQGCVGLVTLRPQEAVFDVLLDGILLFSRTGSLLADGWTVPTPPANPELQGAPEPPTNQPDVPETPSPVQIEVARSLHSYEGTPGHVPLERIYVTGDSGREAASAAALAGQLGIEVSVLEPTIESAPNSHGSPIPVLPAVGLAMGALDPRGMPFDFLHPKRPPVVRDTRRLRQLAIATGVLALFLTTAGLRARWIGERERHRAALQEQVNLGSKNLGAYRLARNQARLLKEWTTGGRDWLDHLTVLSALLPPSPELYVTALSTSARNTLSLAVRVRSGETVDHLTATLRAAGYDVKAPAIMPATDRHGYRFQANLELQVPVAVTRNLEELAVEARPPISAQAKDSPPPESEPAAVPSAPNPAPQPANRPRWSERPREPLAGVGGRPGAAPPRRVTPPDAGPATAPTSAPAVSDESPAPENRRRGQRRPRPEGGPRE